MYVGHKSKKKKEERGNQNVKESHDVNNIMCKQMQLCCVGGEAAKSTNSGNVTRWESQCYVCMYTCLTGFQLQDKPKTTCLSVTQVKMKSTLGIFITS